MPPVHLTCPDCGAEATLYGDLAVPEIACPRCSRSLSVPRPVTSDDPPPSIEEIVEVAKKKAHPWYVVSESSRRSRSGTGVEIAGRRIGVWSFLRPWELPVAVQLLGLIMGVVLVCMLVAWLQSRPSEAVFPGKDAAEEAQRTAEREHRRKQLETQETKMIAKLRPQAGALRPEQAIARWHVHKQGVSALAFSPTVKLLAAAGDDGILLWDLAAGKVKHTLKTEGRKATQIAFSPNGKLLAVAGEDRLVQIWDVAAARPLPVVWHNGLEGSEKIAFAPDGRTVALAGGPAMGSHQSAVSLWDIHTGKRRPVQFHGPEPTSTEALAFLPDGNTLVTGGHAGGAVYLWDSHTGRPRRILQTELDQVTELAVSPDGWTLAVAGFDAQDQGLTVIKLADLESREVRKLGDTRDGPVHVLSFSPDGKHVAAGIDGQVRFWNTATLAELPSFGGDRTDGQALAFSPGGTLLAVSHGSDVLLWSTKPLGTK